MKNGNDIIRSHYEQFILDLDQHRTFSSPHIRNVFRQIPRHLFLEQICVRHDGQWKTIQRPTNDADMKTSPWLSLVYSDQALVTRLDHAGIPTCSSSQPSVMAWMLSALNVQPGHHVLEIGTGMGYNAGLLVFLTHDPLHVTTLDIDATLVNDATTRLHSVIGARIQSHVGNGLEGYAQNAPYDRIIATASYHTVPRTLFQQLKPGGILVMNLRGELAGAFLTLKKQEDGTAVGTIKSISKVSFMAMRDETMGVKEETSFNRIDSYGIPLTVLPPDVFKNRDFLFYLQWRFQHANYYWQSVTLGEQTLLQPRFIDHASASLLKWFPSSTMGYQEIEAYGRTSLLPQLIDAYTDFQSAGSPSPEMYSVLIDQNGKRTMTLDATHIWNIDE